MSGFMRHSFAIFNQLLPTYIWRTYIMHLQIHQISSKYSLNQKIWPNSTVQCISICAISVIIFQCLNQNNDCCVFNNILLCDDISFCMVHLHLAPFTSSLMFCVFAVLSKVKVSFLDTIIRLEHLPIEADTGAALEVRIARWGTTLLPRYIMPFQVKVVLLCCNRNRVVG